jgi:hypothetical protein
MWIDVSHIMGSRHIRRRVLWYRTMWGLNVWIAVRTRRRSRTLAAVAKSHQNHTGLEDPQSSTS